MSGKSIKTQLHKIQINKSVAMQTLGGDCEQFPALSFVHMTSNDKYNYNALSSVFDKKTSKENLYDKIEEITKRAWSEWLSLPKSSGCELLDYSRINFSPKGVTLSKDEKIYIFRFKSHAKIEARILGFRKNKCPTLYIIGYDFNFSAYNHGN